MPQDLALRLIGTAPLLMHCGRLADPLDPHAEALAKVTGKRAKTKADHERIAQLEWRGGLWLAEGKPCIPAEAIESALVTAGKARRAGPVVKAAVAVRQSPILDHRGPADLEEMYAMPAFRLRCGVRVNAKTSIRTRPRFEAWSVTARIAFAPSMIDAETLWDLARYAGEAIGLGDWRPRFGRFRVEEARDVG